MIIPLITIYLWSISHYIPIKILLNHNKSPVNRSLWGVDRLDSAQRAALAALGGVGAEGGGRSGAMAEIFRGPWGKPWENGGLMVNLSDFMGFSGDLIGIQWWFNGISWWLKWTTMWMVINPSAIIKALKWAYTFHTLGDLMTYDWYFFK